MAVGFRSGNKATFAASVASYTVNLDTSGGRAAGLIFAVTFANAGASIFTGATIGGTNAPEVIGGNASDALGEPGHVKAYFLDDITQGASVAFTASRTNNTVVAGIYALCFSTAAAAEAFAVALLEGDGAYAEQSIDDGSPGTDSMRAACGYYGGATPPPVGSNTTIVGTTQDQTAFGCNCGRETTAGQGARLVGFTQATADDRAAVHLAVREIPAAAPAAPASRLARRRLWTPTQRRGQNWSPPVAPPAALEPEQQAGTLIAWWDAQKQTGFVNNDPVGSVTDFGPNGIVLVQTTEADKPVYIASSINGHPGFRHDGISDYLASAAFGSTNAQPNTFVLVFKLSATGAMQTIVDGQFNDATNRHIINLGDAGALQWRIWAGTYLASTGQTIDTNPHILRALYNGASSKIWVDDVEVASGAAGTNALGGITVGRWTDSAANFFNGDWGELLPYEGDITATWPDLYSYLQTKWGFAVVARPPMFASQYAGRW